MKFIVILLYDLFDWISVKPETVNILIYVYEKMGNIHITNTVFR